MRSRRTKRFDECFAHLPPDIQSQARHAYQLFQGNPGHPGLRFKRVHQTEPIYAVRVSRGYRAVGVLKAAARLLPGQRHRLENRVRGASVLDDAGRQSSEKQDEVRDRGRLGGRGKEAVGGR